MNIVHLKYAVEIAKTQSISKAAENLYMGQPNLSRAVRELEESLGITIFNRTPKGISITPDGEEFLQYARRIIAQVDEMEELYQKGQTNRKRFSVSGPRAGYIASAFVAF
ncbi:MAG: LysR family transcriptional regulator, partial [Clostridia bacterium]|nr:LysR family transcriptional regulator [Clostridia bacterium]